MLFWSRSWALAPSKSWRQWRYTSLLVSEDLTIIFSDDSSSGMERGFSDGSSSGMERGDGASVVGEDAQEGIITLHEYKGPGKLVRN